MLIILFFFHIIIQNRPARAAARSKALLWTNRQIYYIFDSSVSAGLQTNIRTALNTIERQTCLRFFHRSSQSDYIRFTSHSEDGCSSYLGRRGGEQEITLGPGCNNMGKIIHEIGHALALWHEHTRPDRDSYVRILSNNVEEERRHNFNKQNSFEVDYQGTTYDYDSVMHYTRTEFGSPSGSTTIEVTNNAEYIRQRRPVLGPNTKN